MSVKIVYQFLETAAKDATLQEKLSGIPCEDKDAAIAEVVRIAANAGFVFSATDYDEALKEQVGQAHAAGELSEAQLEGVAGGTLSSYSSISYKGGGRTVLR